MAPPPPIEGNFNGAVLPLLAAAAAAPLRLLLPAKTSRRHPLGRTAPPKAARRGARFESERRGCCSGTTGRPGLKNYNMVVLFAFDVTWRLNILFQINSH